MTRQTIVLSLLIILLFGCTAAPSPATPTPTTPPIATPLPTETSSPPTPIPEPTITISPPEPTEPDLNTDLGAFYPFNGDANDQSGNENHGEINGDATFTEDRFGNPDSALLLDGVDDFVEIPHAQSIGLTFKSTVSAWVLFEPQDIETWYTIVEKSDPERGGHSRYGIWLIRDQAEFCVQPAGQPSHYCLDSAEPLSEDEWTHIVGVWTGSILQMYINGQLSLEETYGGSAISSTPYSMFIGTDQYSDRVVYTRGAIDDIRIYRRALAPEEVLELFELE